ncbi:MAG TPA: serine/threonine-protein kinase [Streptosporangiaceae bacterium]|nr:serine/threonine-protein kinase [Streptosporangiaceae bacterium]
MSAPADGRLIAGRYRLAAVIGQGCMGRVWRARDELLGRAVAIKEVLLPPGLSEAEKDNLCRRMLREARSAARLSHPAVATVHDVVEDLGRPWIVMELVPGRSLDDVIEKDGPLPPGAVAQIGRQLLGALAAAHAVGVLHRDVKPSNVLLTRDGRAVLTDFGVATIANDPSLTETGMVAGTPAFCAPERIRGELATPAADLWSLGATLYAAVEGQGPYEHHGGATATIAAIVTDDPRPPRTAGPLAAPITAFLSRNPASRPSVATATRMLEKAAAGQAETPSRRNPRRRTPPRPRQAAAAALTCLAVALPISIWALRHPAARHNAVRLRARPAIPKPPPASPSSGPFTISGSVSCASGNAVVGLWVAARKGAGFSGWHGWGNGATATFRYRLPRKESYSLHVGCGGSSSSWQVATYSVTVTTAVNNFACFDVHGQPSYGTCRTT